MGKKPSTETKIQERGKSVGDSRALAYSKEKKKKKKNGF